MIRQEPGHGKPAYVMILHLHADAACTYSQQIIVTQHNNAHPFMPLGRNACNTHIYRP